MGSEGKGISGELLRLSDNRVKIPLMGKIESLNVSVSAGIVLFEALRQRMVNAKIK
jgi:23S rRNA (guanosine2251-2'-O)-methyltransferase